MMPGYCRRRKPSRDWLLRAVAGDPSQMQDHVAASAVSGTSPESTVGEATDHEKLQRRFELATLASDQFQLDVYGGVMDARNTGATKGIDASEGAWSLRLRFAEFVENHWQEPDGGIWEVPREVASISPTPR